MNLIPTTLNIEYLVASIVGPLLITFATIFSQKIKDSLSYMVKYVSDLSVDELCFTIDGSFTRVFSSGVSGGLDNYTKDTGGSNKAMINAILHVLETQKQQVVSNTYNIYNKSNGKRFKLYESYNKTLTPGFGVSEKFVYYKDMKFLVNDTFSSTEKIHSYTKKIFIYKKKNGKSNKENIEYIKTFIEECVAVYEKFNEPDEGDDRVFLYKLPYQNKGGVTTVYGNGLKNNKYEIQSKKCFKNTFFPEKSLLVNMLDSLQNKKIDKLGLLLYGIAGSGKCHGFDTPILMFDGTVKMVQDIQVGDLVMGDDSTSRKVLSLGRGRDTMYKITNVKGENYIVNSEHILCLNYSNNKLISNDKKYNRFRVKWFNNTTIKLDMKDFYYKNKDEGMVLSEAKTFMDTVKEDKICEISVKDYIKLPKTMNSLLKGYSVKIDFQEQPLEFDPYIIGLWLGDGSAAKSEITSQDSTILHYLANILPKYKCYLQYGTKYTHRINGESINGNKNNINAFLNTLRENDLLNNKHIPHIYKCNSRENRLKLLAGLLDSDGCLSKDKSGYEFSQSLKHEQLLDDTVYLCRSLGFACYKKLKKTSWTHNGVKKYGEAWRICISGENLDEIPVLCPRKKANARKQIKDVLVSGIRVEELPEDDYYGFELDGNNRYVLGNFIVTHNTSLLKSISNYTRRNLIYIDLNAIKNETELVNIFFQQTLNIGGQSEDLKYTKRIYVIEDIDADSEIVLSRKTQEKKAENPTFIIQNKPENIFENQEKLTLKHLLQLFDGILELKDVIYIFTTNHIEKLDEALIRPGRINMKIHMTYMTNECINEMVKYNFPDDDFDFKGDVKITPSNLECMILQSGEDFETFKETFDAFCKENPKKK